MRGDEAGFGRQEGVWYKWWGTQPPVPEPKERAVKALVGVNCLVCGLDPLFEINFFRDDCRPHATP